MSVEIFTLLVVRTTLSVLKFTLSVVHKTLSVVYTTDRSVANIYSPGCMLYFVGTLSAVRTTLSVATIYSVGCRH